jgi:hypothetical protein
MNLNETPTKYLKVMPADARQGSSVTRARTGTTGTDRLRYKVATDFRATQK